MDDLLQQFLIEGPELTQQASEDLLALERTPGDTALIDSAFRAVHTLKGSVGLFDLQPMAEALHAAEDLLGALRDGVVAGGADQIDVLIACVSQVDRWLEDIAGAGVLHSDAPEIAAGLVARLRAGLGGQAAAAILASPLDTSWVPGLIARLGAPPGERLVAVRYRPDGQSYFNGDDPLAIARSTPGLLVMQVEAPLADAAAYDPFNCTLVFHLLSNAPLTAVQAAFRLAVGQAEMVEVEPAAARGMEAAGRYLRVDAERLDQLADLVDELVVAKNALAQISSLAQAGETAVQLAPRLRETQTLLERVTGGLHRGVMAARMAPFGPAFRRLPRLVREAANGLGKTVDVVLDGQDVEADKSVVDAVFEPLLHIVRNAVDHGIETPQERARLGKLERAVITIKARQQGDRVVIEVADDGRGFDPQAIGQAARRRGLVDDEALAALTERELLDLVFLPGFSTAQAVTALSGRGVGMDAVRTAVARLGGQVALSGHAGQGAVVALSLPLTMVMSRIMLVGCGGERFGVPMEDLLETVQASPDRILPIRHGQAFTLREQTVPVVDLADLLGLERTTSREGDRKVLVVSARGEPVGVVVDAIAERLDVVLRPMDGLLSEAPGVMGTTLLGDGQVLMVLDLPELIG